MPRIPSRPYPSRLAHRLREDDGFGMIEVMVSAVLVIAIALATLKLLDGAQTVSANNRSRDVAAQIAQSEQDKIRQLPMTSLAGGYHVQNPVPVGGVTYTAVTDAKWVTDSGGPVSCSTSNNVAYLATTTSVTWPAMGKTKPVTADAIVDPGVAAVGAKKGALTVLLTRADGTGTSGITVTAGGMSAVTDDNGCAVIGNIDPGPQTLAYNTTGYVDKDSKQQISRNVTIGAGTIAQATGFYDNPGYATLTTPVDTTVGSVWNGRYSIDHDQRSLPTLFTIQGDTDSSGVPAQYGLWPFASAYRWYAGDCIGNNPAKYGAPNQGAQMSRNDHKDFLVDLPTATVKVDYGSIGTTNRTATLIVEGDTAVSPMSPCGNQSTSYPVPGSVNKNSGTVSYKFRVPDGVWKACAFVRYTSTSYTRAATSFSSGTDIVATPTGTTGTYAPKLTSGTLTPAGSGSGNNTPPSTANC
jgi:Tfp pilus assembly protein PilV